MKKDIFQAMARAIIRNKYSLHFGRLFGKVFWFYWVSCYQEPFLPSVRSSSVQITNYHQIVSNLLIASESTRLIIREETAFKVLLRPNRGSRKLHFVWKKKQYLKSSTELQKVTKIINILWINSQFGTFLKNWFEIFFKLLSSTPDFVSNELTSVFFCVACSGNFLPRPPQ